MWLLFALGSRFLWAIGGAAEQVQARAYTRQRILAPLVLGLCLAGPFAGIAYCLAGGVTWSQSMFYWAVLGTVTSVLAILPYYKCLQHEQVFNVVPLFELTPVFLTILAMVIYKEKLTPPQMLGAAIIIGCGFAFSWDFQRGHIKAGILALMSLSSLLFSIQQLSLKSAGAFGNVWQVTFYFSCGSFITGLIAFLALNKVRRSIIDSYTESGGKTLLIAVGIRTVSFLALASLIFAFQEAPSTGHVAALSGTQPFFSFMLAIILGKRLPKHYQEIVPGHEMAWKMFLLAGIFFGVYLLT